MENRVVVTGMGAITPIGNNVEEFWKGILEGKCGIDKITAYDTTRHKVALAAEVKNFDPEEALGKKEARKLDRFSQFAVVAAKEAMADSGLDNAEFNHERFGVIISSGIGGLNTMETACHTLFEKGPERVSPYVIPMMIGNMATGNVSIAVGAKGYSSSVVTACAGGTHAIGDAYRMIKHGYQDVMLCGGTEASIVPVGVAGFANIKALNQTTDPQRASIPFDKERAGFVMGEGAGVIVLESLEHAKKRGAKIYAELVGYGVTSDAYHITSPLPDGNGGARSMQAAIDEAGIKASEVDYINAHGTSTPLNDRCETMAIKTVFGEDTKVMVSSTKGNTAHLLGAAGGVEAIVCIKAILDKFVPPTIGYKVPDEECDLDIVPNEGRNVEIKYAMSNSLGFGGHNSSVLFKKYED